MNADRKQAEEILQKMKSEMPYFLPTEFEPYIIEAITLFRPLPEITEEEIKTKITDAIYADHKCGIETWSNARNIIEHVFSLLSERKEQKTTEQHVPTDEQIKEESDKYASDMCHSNKYRKGAFTDYEAGMFRMREMITGVLSNRETHELDYTKLSGEFTDKLNQFDEKKISEWLSSDRQKGAPFDEEKTKSEL